MLCVVCTTKNGWCPLSEFGGNGIYSSGSARCIT
jgi:hypothetical protein